jgi:HSP20 family protein
MAIQRWDPFRDLDLLPRLASRGLGHRMLLPEFDLPANDWTPSADIGEKDNEYVIRADLPAVRREDAKVAVDGDVITISGERKEDKEEKTEKLVRRESFRGSFTRSFQLPKDADATRINAECKDGVLTVRIPRKVGNTPARTEIKVE